MSDEKWLIMVYLAGDNNLTNECIFALTEMKRVNTEDRIKVVAQFDPLGSKLPVHRYEINKGGVSGDREAGDLAKDIIPYEPSPYEYPYPTTNVSYGPEETDTGSPKALFDFITWAVSKNKSDYQRYLLILAGHGAGTEKDYLLKDENPTGSLSIPDLKRALEAAADVSEIQFDILGLDVCLMSMAEICWELRGPVEYMVASESYSPRAGWPYRQILSQLDAELRANGAVDPKDAASMIVREYIRFYSDYVLGGLSVDQAAIHVKAAGDLICAIRIFARVLTEELEHKEFRDEIILAHWEAQSYNGEQFVDLYHFCELLAKRYEANDVAALCRQVMRVIDGSLVTLSCFDGVKYQYSYGLSIYFPWSEVVPYYENLSFAGASGWYGFLTEYVAKTKVEPRGFPENNVYFIPDLREFRKTDFHGPDDDVPRSMRNPPDSLAFVPRCVDQDDVIETFGGIRFR